jgi:hypothetical protein
VVGRETRKMGAWGLADIKFAMINNCQSCVIVVRDTSSSFTRV